jgi:hypothetical protein
MLRAAVHALPARPDRTYALLTTAAVMLTLISTDRLRWVQAANRVGISLDAYEASLHWASAHPMETIAAQETQLDAALPGIRLTAELSKAAAATERIAALLAGTETPRVAGILAAVCLTVTGADARGGLAGPARLALREVILQDIHGALVPNLDALVAAMPSEQTPPPAAPPATRRQASRAETAGFNVGTFIGAFIVAVLGGASWSAALLFAWLVRTVAARARRKQRSQSQRPLHAVAAAALIAAIVLGVTAGTGFTDERQAAQRLGTAREAIARGDLVHASPELGRAGLLENQSVHIRILASCADWALGFKDHATLEAQLALNLGYRPGEATHYQGRGCFLDTPDFHGVTFMKVSKLKWAILPRPDVRDALGRRYYEIAEQQRSSRSTETFVALGCLADRYDFRSLAAFMFTVGLNGNLRLGAGPTPFPEIRGCLRSCASRYKFFTEPQTRAEVFVPTDMATRIPSPSRPHPPTNACWAKFPSSGPCNADE